MSSPADERFPKPESGIDAVVRAHLDAEAAKVDGAAVRNAVLTRLEADAPPVQPTPAKPRSGARAYLLLAAASIAAVVAFAVFSYQPPQALASPAVVLEEAEAAHARGADRCYKQTVTVIAGERAARAADWSRVVTVCTRGDRFVIEPGFGGRGAWGRDEHGRVWFAPTREAAARCEQTELPPGLQEAVEIRRLELPTLLNTLRKHGYELSWSEQPTRGAPTYAIRAVPPKNDPPALRAIASAELVVEKDTKLVRSLALRRHTGVGTVDVKFELVDTTEKDPSVYTAEGHIKTGAPVYDAAQPRLRRAVIFEHLREIVNGQ